MVSGVKIGGNKWFSLETMSTFSGTKQSFNVKAHFITVLSLALFTSLPLATDFKLIVKSLGNGPANKPKPH